MTIQQLNDAFRTSLSANLGRIMMTSDVARLEPKTTALILDAVRRYDRSQEKVRPEVLPGVVSLRFLRI